MGEAHGIAHVHSEIGASSMHRWASCPGSVRLSRGLPPRTSKYAEEGTGAHDLAAERLLKKEYPAVMTDEQLDAIEAVDLYVNFVEKLASEKNAKLYVEQKFDLSKVYPGLFGTADAVVHISRTKTLYVVDYKHGAGVPVEVANSAQLQYYALGALLSLALPVERVVLYIVQPRCNHPNGPIRHWTLAPSDLMDFSFDLMDAAQKTEAKDAPLFAGEWCRFCPASVVCPLVGQKAQELVAQKFSVIDDTPVTDVTPQKLANMLEWLPTLEQWIKNVREFAYAKVERGEKVPGWKLVAKRATRKWTDEKAMCQFLEKEYTNTQQFFTRELKSPAQLEKVLPKSEHGKIAARVTAVSSGNTLVAESDSRPEVLILPAAQIFTEIEGEK